ncbi:MAG: hypothetical protein RL885_06320 [Planctomycetota bacterium]
MLFETLTADPPTSSGWFSSFLLALGAGTSGVLLLLPRDPLTPAFFRLHCWIGLGLAGISLAFRWPDFEGESAALWTAWLTAAYCGAVFLQILVADRPRLAGGFLITSTLAAAAALVLDGARIDSRPIDGRSITLGIDLVSAAFALGASNVAMLLGHWYLVGKDLPIGLLKRMIVALGVSIALRAIAPPLLTWAGGHTLPEGAAERPSEFLLGDGLFALMKVSLGILLPGALAWMSYQCARLRNTMAATGILYVALVFVLVGELISTYLVATLSLPW